LKSGLGLVLLLIITFLAPAMAIWSQPGTWYAALNKPSWNPPSWLFGPVWTVLYILMAVAAWIVWKRGGGRRVMALYGVQLVLNAAWSPIFFGLKMPGLAFAEILLLLAAILFTTRVFARYSTTAAYMLVPYILWVSFASFLNFTLWRMNA
jgi:tryptophan-rich sensory protein